MTLKSFIDEGNAPAALPVSTRVQVLLSANVDLVEPVTLVTQIYRDAPTEIQGKILNTAIKPLGILSLAAVANGKFFRAAFQNPYTPPTIALDQISAVSIDDVSTLLDISYQISAEVFDGLTHVILASPDIATTVSGLLLIAWIAKRKKHRRLDD